MMKTRFISLALLIALIGLTVQSVSRVQAQQANQEQELEQRVDVECTAGAYGQGQVCGVTTEQRGRQRQEIILREGVAPHQVAPTALDGQTLALVTGLLASGGLSIVGLIKTKTV